ncbi:MAG: HU family DNA-binding protein [Trichlorobacter sp.]|nr:HU family DNA-binding protein [Trichlorobacter sp.]
MTKADFVAAVAEKAGLKKTDAANAVASFIEVVTEALKNNDEICLVGFGTFSTVKREARTGQNPQTGEKINIPASIAPKFKPGKALKEAVNH